MSAIVLVSGTYHLAAITIPMVPPCFALIIRKPKIINYHLNYPKVLDDEFDFLNEVHIWSF
jgi:hypothetical protein